LRRPNHRSSL